MSAITLLGWLSSSPRYSEASQIIPTVNSVVQALNSGVLTQLNQLIYPTIPSAPVNLLGITSANAGGTVKLTVDGQSVETNANILLTGHGASVVSIGGTTALSANASMRVVSLANAANWLQVTGATSASPTVTLQATGASAAVNLNILAGGTGTVGVNSATGTQQFNVGANTDGVGGVNITNVSTGTNAYSLIYFGSSASTTDGLFGLVGSGNSSYGGARSYILGTNTATPVRILTAGITMMEVSHTANAANWLQLTGGTSATGVVTLGAAGTNAEVFIALTPKGSSSATVKFGNATCFAANSTVASAFTASQGPTNARSDIQKWLRIIDQAGASYFIPMW